MAKIVGHDWRFGNLHLKVEWDTGQTTWEIVKDMKLDHLSMIAQHIVNSNVTRSRRGGDRLEQLQINSDKPVRIR